MPHILSGNSSINVAHSPLIVTPWMTRFAKLLVRQMMQKLSKHRWMDPVKTGDKTKAHKGLEGRETMGKWVT